MELAIIMFTMVSRFLRSTYSKNKFFLCIHLSKTFLYVNDFYARLILINN